MTFILCHHFIIVITGVLNPISHGRGGGNLPTQVIFAWLPENLRRYMCVFYSNFRIIYLITWKNIFGHPTLGGSGSQWFWVDKIVQPISSQWKMAKKVSIFMIILYIDVRPWKKMEMTKIPPLECNYHVILTSFSSRRPFMTSYRKIGIKYVKIVFRNSFFSFWKSSWKTSKTLLVNTHTTSKTEPTFLYIQVGGIVGIVTVFSGNFRIWIFFRNTMVIRPV